MEITVKITGLEDLTKAITGWTDALQALQMPRVNTVINVPEQNTQPSTTPVTPQPAAPVNVIPVTQFTAPHPEASTPQYAQQPVIPAVTQAAIPTTAPTYALDQLAIAATQLVDAGRMNDLMQLLASFGVQALTVLPKEQYGNFATQLRALGAKI